MMQQTSLEAYDKIQHELSGRRLEVYNSLKRLEVANNTTLALDLRWGINRVTPRIKELRDMGLVVKDSIRICPFTKMKTIYWKVKK